MERTRTHESTVNIVVHSPGRLRYFLLLITSFKFAQMKAWQDLPGSKRHQENDLFNT